MVNLLTLWREGGLPVHVLLFLFSVAFLMLLAQLVLARKIHFPGLFVGWAASILAWTVVGTGVGYRLVLDILVETERGNPGLAFKGNEAVLLNPFFALGAVSILLVLRLGVEAVTSRDLARSFPLSRTIRSVGGLALLGVTIGGVFIVRVVMVVNRLYAQREPISPEIADSIDGYLTSGIAAGIAGLVFGLITVALSVFSGVRLSLAARRPRPVSAVGSGQERSEIG
jgi:hypothetical protein